MYYNSKRSPNYVNEDSFGSEFPADWEAAAAYINQIIEENLDDDGMIGIDVEEQIWENYCNGKYEGKY